MKARRVQTALLTETRFPTVCKGNSFKQYIERGFFSFLNYYWKNYVEWNDKFGMNRESQFAQWGKHSFWKGSSQTFILWLHHSQQVRVDFCYAFKELHDAQPVAGLTVLRKTSKGSAQRGNRNNLLAAEKHTFFPSFIHFSQQPLSP